MNNSNTISNQKINKFGFHSVQNRNNVNSSIANNVTYYYSKSPLMKLKPLEKIITPRYVRFKESEEIINNNIKYIKDISNNTNNDNINLFLNRIDNLESYIININNKLDKLIIESEKKN